jgi:hypothetical protein
MISAIARADESCSGLAQRLTRAFPLRGLRPLAPAGTAASRRCASLAAVGNAWNVRRHATRNGTEDMAHPIADTLRRCSVPALTALVLGLAAPRAGLAQRIAPARFSVAPVHSPYRPFAPSAVASVRREFSLPAMAITGLVGAAVGAFLGYHYLRFRGEEERGAAGLLIGGVLGFSIGATWYAVAH